MWKKSVYGEGSRAIVGSEHTCHLLRKTMVPKTSITRNKICVNARRHFETYPYYSRLLCAPFGLTVISSSMMGGWGRLQARKGSRAGLGVMKENRLACAFARGMNNASCIRREPWYFLSYPILHQAKGRRDASPRRAGRTVFLPALHVSHSHIVFRGISEMVM